MRKYVVCLFLSAGLLVAAVCGMSSAQDDEGLDYTWGIVKAVNPSQITIAEYDYEKSAEVNVEYSIDPAVKLQNVNAIKDIILEDEVELEFSLAGDKKVAKSISVVKQPTEESAMPVPEEADQQASEMEQAPAAGDSSASSPVSGQVQSGSSEATAK